MKTDDIIMAHRIKYRSHWRNKSDLYWMWRVFLEFIELLLSLLKLHRHTPETEKMQIAGIMANWIEYRNNYPDPNYGDEKLVSYVMEQESTDERL